MRTRRPTRTTALVLLLGLLATACSLGGEDAADGDVAQTSADLREEPADEAPAMDFDDAAPPPEAPSEAGDADVPATMERTRAVLGRSVIRTATIDLEVPDPSATVDEVTRIAERNGGFVATADLQRDREDQLRGTVTLRVPSDELLRVLDALEELSDGPSSRRIDEQDVTTEVADLEARLANLTAYERELSELLTEVRERTADPDDLLRIFERVRSVREEIDVLEGRLAVLSEQISMATVTARITPAPVGQPIGDPTWQPGDTLREAVAALARTLGTIADGAIWLAVAVLPVLALVGLPFALLFLVWWRRRTPRPAAATAGGGAPTAGDGPTDGGPPPA